MAVPMVKIGRVSVSRMILGGNPFSGFSHLSPQRDEEMRHYYTVARIKEAYRLAERAGVNTHIGRADHHIMRCLLEYWDEGGAIQWIAQTCPEVGSIARGVANGISGGAKACFLHGGMMDGLFARGELGEVPGAIETIRRAGLAAGIAAHDPAVHRWADRELDLDFHMCSYYNPVPRDRLGQHVPGAPERYDPADRDAMLETIAQLRRPAIHYKVLAAGRHDPAEALAFVARHLRPQDAVCVGVFLKDAPDSIERNLRLLGF